MLTLLSNNNLIESRAIVMPQAVPLQVTNESSSSAFGTEINTETTIVEVIAVTKDLYVKWGDNGEDYATSEDFHEYIPAGTSKIFEVPQYRGNQDSTLNGTKYPWLQVVGSASGGRAILIEK